MALSNQGKSSTRSPPCPCWNQSELIKMMEEKFGVSAAAAAVAVGCRARRRRRRPGCEEQTEFTVMLLDAGANKVERRSRPCAN